MHAWSVYQRQRIFKHVPRRLLGAVGLNGTSWSFDWESEDTTRGSADPDTMEDRRIDVVGFGVETEEVLWW